MIINTYTLYYIQTGIRLLVPLHDDNYYTLHSDKIALGPKVHRDKIELSEISWSQYENHLDYKEEIIVLKRKVSRQKDLIEILEVANKNRKKENEELNNTLEDIIKELKDITCKHQQQQKEKSTTKN